VLISMAVTARTLSSSFQEDWEEMHAKGFLFTQKIAWDNVDDLKQKLDEYFGPQWVCPEMTQLNKDIVKGASAPSASECLVGCQAGLFSWLLRLKSAGGKRLAYSLLGELAYRKGHKHGTSLAPAISVVQGPHQETMVVPNRGNMRYIVFGCKQPAFRDGNTALFDMAKAWTLLPSKLQDRLNRSSWLVTDQTTIPCVVKHDVTGEPCIQFFGFGHCATACVDVYRSMTGKYHVDDDPTAYAQGCVYQKPWLTIDEKGNKTPFIGLDLYTFLDCIYKTMIVKEWSKGDVVIVDNVKFAHGRLEGPPGGDDKRDVLFLSWGSRKSRFNIFDFERVGPA